MNSSRSRKFKIPSRYLVLSDLNINIPLIFPHIPSLIFLTKITLIRSHTRLWLLSLSLKPLIIGPHIFFFIFSCLIPTMYLYTLQAYETNCFFWLFLASAGLTFLRPKYVGYVRGERLKGSNIEI